MNSSIRQRGCGGNQRRAGMQDDRREGRRPPEGMLLYGIHPVREKLRAAPDEIIELLLVSGARGSSRHGLEQMARQRRRPVSVVDARALDALTKGAPHQGVAARVAPFAYGSFQELLLAAVPSPGADRVLFLDGVRDPRNFGSILRTCEAMGVSRIVIPQDRAAGVTGAVIKASAGAVHHVRLYRIPNLFRGVMALRERGYWLVGLDARADDRAWERVYPEKLAVVLGGEERGIRPRLRGCCDYLVSIPMAGRVDSLNVSVAWGMFAYELRRNG